MDEKRYQVFVSSTYTDLTEERAAVIQAIQRMDHLPAGMELFPAADEDQWELIKQVIDQSDYYVVVVAGRYGSISADGISYTEKEYDYAVESGIPVLGFVHKDPGTIPGGKLDLDAKAQELLAAFREKVQGKPVNFFNSAEGLSGLVVTSLIRAIKTHPRMGWVRGDKAMTIDQQAEIVSLREQINSLKLEKIEAESALVEDTSTLAQGADPTHFSVNFAFYEDEGGRRKKYHFDSESSPTWDELFGEIGPPMIDEASTKELRARTGVAIHRHADISTYLERNPDGKRSDLTNESPTGSHWETIEIQLRALGLIESSPKKHGVQDNGKYLSLTAKGLRHLAQIRAIHRTPESPSK